MKFVTVQGVKGKVFAPDFGSAEKKKHGCPDCFYCQKCSDDRCTICLKKNCNKNLESCCSDLKETRESTIE